MFLFEIYSNIFCIFNIYILLSTFSRVSTAMKTNPLLFVTYLAVTILFGLSCESELPEPEIVEEKFSLKAFDAPIIENLAIDFTDFQTITVKRSSDAEEEIWNEYNATFNGHYFMEDSLGKRIITFTLLENVIDQQNSEFTLLKFVPAMPGQDSIVTYTYFNLQDFSGTIYTYSQDGINEYVIGVTEGMVQGHSAVMDKKFSSSSRTSMAPPPGPCDNINLPCDPGDPATNGYYTWVIYKVYIDEFLIKTVGNFSITEYIGSTTEIETRNVWVPSNSYPPNNPHDHVSSGNNGLPTTTPHPNGFMRSDYQAWKNQIDLGNDFRNNECLMGIFDQLITNSGDLYGTLINFTGSSPVADISFNLVDESTDTDFLNQKAKLGHFPNALTQSQLENGQLSSSTIKIGKTFLENSTTIEIAKTIIHEAIHAEIKSIAYSTHRDEELLKKDFPTIYEIWKKGSYTIGTGDHNLMANDYIPKIVEAVKEYDFSQFGSNIDEQFFEGLAWKGLQKTDIWNNMEEYLQDLYMINAAQLINRYKNAGKEC